MEKFTGKLPIKPRVTIKLPAASARNEPFTTFTTAVKTAGSCPRLHTIQLYAWIVYNYTTAYYTTVLEGTRIPGTTVEGTRLEGTRPWTFTTFTIVAET